MDWTSVQRRAENTMASAMSSMDDLVDRGIAEVDEQLAEVEKRTAERIAGEAETWRELATAPNAPAQWQRVVERVELGELDWTDIAAGRVTGDPDVAAAILASTARQPEPAADAVAVRDDNLDYSEDEPFGGSILRRR